VPKASEGGQMYYVYRLQYRAHPEQKYTGFTTDFDNRFKAHNSGQVPHTSKYLPWELVNLFSFVDENKAKSFEKYLKSGSGRAFAKQHF